MAYKHGIYGNIIPSQNVLPPDGVATLPVYVGTAPVQQLSDYSKAVNQPILVNGYDEAKAALGYDDDWKMYTLCEAVYAHFKNAIKSIGPIVLINVMDPETHNADGTATVTVTSKKGYIEDHNVILNTITIDGIDPQPTFTAAYMDDGKIMLTFTDDVPSSITVKYKKVDKSKVTTAAVAGGIGENGQRTGLACIDLIYQKTGFVPSIIGAPGYSGDKVICDELILKTQKINGHWDAITAVDIDSSASGALTINAAITKKETGSYTSKYAKVCWPQIKYGDRIFHLSTLAAVCMQQMDYANGNTPYVSPSNKQIMAGATVLDNGNPVIFDEVQANSLNAKGITTVNYAGGQWRLWGPHMGNYDSDDTSIKPEDMSDCSVRMLEWLSNTFQQKYVSSVDQPMNKHKVETILDDAKVWLNSLVADGKLLYADITFQESSNSLADMAAGDFVFDVKTTTTPPGKSLTFNIQYTEDGLSVLYGGEA